MPNEIWEEEKRAQPMHGASPMGQALEELLHKNPIT